MSMREAFFKGNPQFRTMIILCIIGLAVLGIVGWNILHKPVNLSGTVTCYIDITDEAEAVDESLFGTASSGNPVYLPCELSFDKDSFTLSSESTVSQVLSAYTRADLESYLIAGVKDKGYATDPEALDALAMQSGATDWQTFVDSTLAQLQASSEYKNLTGGALDYSGTYKIVSSAGGDGKASIISDTGTVIGTGLYNRDDSSLSLDLSFDNSAPAALRNASFKNCLFEVHPDNPEVAPAEGASFVMPTFAESTAATEVPTETEPTATTAIPVVPSDTVASSDAALPVDSAVPPATTAAAAAAETGTEAPAETSAA